MGRLAGSTAISLVEAAEEAVETAEDEEWDEY
jgi:hypothetical protein